MPVDYAVRKARDDPHASGASGRSGKRLPRYHQLVSVDSEGTTDSAGRHHCTLLMAVSDTQSWECAGDSLTYREIFPWLTSLPLAGALCVMYSLNYDVTMWCKALPRSIIKTLVDKGRAYCRVDHVSYCLDYIPSRFFRLARLTATGERARSLTLYDQFGFFQTSFIKALDSWGIGSEAERALIRRMKERREEFASLDAAQIHAYCLLENRLHVALCRALYQAIDEAGIRPRHYYGAGGLAASLLHKHEVREYNAPPEEWARQGYYGGRFEIRYIGHVPQAYSYDINSAYPAQTVQLPCLAHARYLRSSGPANALLYGDWALWRVRWQIPAASPWPPFPVRLPSGHICYPTRGEGWYWAREVAQAERLFPLDITRLECIRVVPTCDHQPFEWLHASYQHRAQLKAAGAPAHVPLKLAINSIYGKTAQQIGWRESIPAYHNLIWAGLITSGCRAQILGALALDPEAVLSIATDGLISTRPLPLREGTALGTWTAKPIRDVWIFQSGVYAYLDQDGSQVYHSRGYSGERELPLAKLRGHLLTYQGVYGLDYPVTRFIGLRSGVLLRDYARKMGEWLTTKRHFQYVPSSLTGARCFKGDGDWTHDLSEIGGLWLEMDSDYLGADIVSQPYPRRSTWNEYNTAELDVTEMMLDEDQP